MFQAIQNRLDALERNFATAIKEQRVRNSHVDKLMIQYFGYNLGEEVSKEMGHSSKRKRPFTSDDTNPPDSNEIVKRRCQEISNSGRPSPAGSFQTASQMEHSVLIEDSHIVFDYHHGRAEESASGDGEKENQEVESQSQSPGPHNKAKANACEESSIVGEETANTRQKSGNASSSLSFGTQPEAPVLYSSTPVPAPLEEEAPPEVEAVVVGTGANQKSQTQSTDDSTSTHFSGDQNFDVSSQDVNLMTSDPGSAPPVSDKSSDSIPANQEVSAHSSESNSNSHPPLDGPPSRTESHNNNSEHAEPSNSNSSNEQLSPEVRPRPPDPDPSPADPAPSPPENNNISPNLSSLQGLQFKLPVDKETPKSNNSSRRTNKGITPNSAVSNEFHFLNDIDFSDRSMEKSKSKTPTDNSSPPNPETSPPDSSSTKTNNNNFIVNNMEMPGTSTALVAALLNQSIPKPSASASTAPLSKRKLKRLKQQEKHQNYIKERLKLAKAFVSNNGSRNYLTITIDSSREKPVKPPSSPNNNNHNNSHRARHNSHTLKTLTLSSSSSSPPELVDISESPPIPSQ